VSLSYGSDAVKFTKTSLPRLWLVELSPQRDTRGFFARTFCEEEFAARRLETNFVQHSISYSKIRGTVRGLHFQNPPHEETKVVSCYKGTIWDVVVDLRQDSPTYGQWTSFILSGENRRSLYIPKGCAHGFQTLTDHVEVAYMISTSYVPEAAAGVRFDDPVFKIDWPLSATAMSDKDRNWPNYILDPSASDAMLSAGAYNAASPMSSRRP
jgi:dTDP-4-dehydrorhamnose 3,5-epimerase